MDRYEAHGLRTRRSIDPSAAQIAAFQQLPVRAKVGSGSLEHEISVVEKVCPIRDLEDERARRSAFFGGLVDRGVSTGEVAAERAAEVAVVVDMLILGLNDGAMDGMKRQLAAIAAIKSAIRSLVCTNRDNRRTS